MKKALIARTKGQDDTNFAFAEGFDYDSVIIKDKCNLIK